MSKITEDYLTNIDYRRINYKTFFEKYLLDVDGKINIGGEDFFPINWKFGGASSNLKFMLSFDVTESSYSQSIIHSNVKVHQFNYQTETEEPDVDIYCIHTVRYEKNKTKSEQIIMDFVEFFMTFREDYKYSKIFDKFITIDGGIDDEYEESELEHLFLQYEANPYREYKCAVCYSPSATFTKCGHNVCRECFSSIKKDNEKCCDNCRYKACPICREKFVIGTIEDDDILIE